MTGIESEILSGLKSATIFKHLQEGALAEVMQQTEVVRFKCEDVIVAEGDPGDRLFIIIQGIVKIKKVIPDQHDKILAYLLPGNTFGELGILENKPRSATAQALTDVNALCIDREIFLSMLHRYPSIAIELAKLLGHYLTETNKRLTQGGREKKVVFIIDRYELPGVAKFARQLAIKLKGLNEHPTVLAEFPGVESLSNRQSFTFGSGGRTIHEDNIDILNAYTTETKTNHMQLALYVDDLLNQYDNLVILLKQEFAHNPGSVLESADQVIILSPPDEDKLLEVINFQKTLKSQIRGNTSNVYSVMINKSETQFIRPREPDLEIMMRPAKHANNKVPGTKKVTYTPAGAAVYLTERLHRDNQVGILIPTIRQDGIPTESDAIIDRTLDFLGKRFGGATCEEVKGVWHSHASGLIGEKVFKIHTYVSAVDLRKHMGDIVDFVRTIKSELSQEAMALEINHKLTLL